MNWEIFLNQKEKRCLNLLYLLEKYPCQTVELQQIIQVSQKTLKRDLRELEKQAGFHFQQINSKISWENPQPYTQIKRDFLRNSTLFNLLKDSLQDNLKQPPKHHQVRRLNHLIKSWEIWFDFKTLKIAGNPLVINKLRQLLAEYDQISCQEESFWREEWCCLLAENPQFANFYDQKEPLKKQGCLFLMTQLKVAEHYFESSQKDLIEPVIITKVTELLELISDVFGPLDQPVYEKIFQKCLVFYLMERVGFPLPFIFATFEKKCLRQAYRPVDYRRVAKVTTTQALLPIKKTEVVENAKIFFYILEPLFPRVFHDQEIRIGLALNSSHKKQKEFQHYLQKVFQNLIPLHISLVKNKQQRFDLIITDQQNLPISQIPLLYFEHISEKDVAIVLHKRLFHLQDH